MSKSVLSTSNTESLRSEFLSKLRIKALRARERLMRFSREVSAWHLRSAESALNIIAALYGFWVPMGFVRGVERLVVISKGHCSLALYSWLTEVGAINECELRSFATPNSRLQAHPEVVLSPWVVAPTGSLGQGLSIANGLALAARLDGVRREVAVLLGDGELDEGQVWEAAATTSTLGLDNVLAVIDRNGTQHTGRTEDVKVKEPLRARWEAFGWLVAEVSQDVTEVAEVLEELSGVRGRPKVVIVRSCPEG